MTGAMEFEGLGLCFYNRGEFRAPKKGEYYLSGAIVTAWRAQAEFPADCKYRIVVPTYRAESKTVWVKGEKITANSKRSSITSRR